jgi:hypothetical protein
MYGTLEKARVNAIDLARGAPVGYVYKLFSGSFYVSANPPSMMSGELVTSFYFSPTGYLMEGNRQVMPAVWREA